MQTNLVPVTFDKRFTKKLRIAIVRTNYHAELVDNLELLAQKTLLDTGVKEKSIKTFVVPGSWEIPLLVKKVAERKKYDAIIAFGVLVKGETHHFDLIASEVASALMQLSIDYNIPVIFEVLAVYNVMHAQTRTALNEYNKGIEAANAALQMIYSLRSVT